MIVILFSLSIAIAAYYGIENSFRKLAPLVLQVSVYNLAQFKAQSVAFCASLNDPSMHLFLPLLDYFSTVTMEIPFTHVRI